MDVSIVVPVYNSEAFLTRLAKSLTGQTGCEEIEYEILLVNDGSTDRSLEICRDLAEKHKKIQVFTQENKGPSAARNLGIANAKGKYLLFSDADDYLEPDSVSILVRLAEQEQADLVIFGLYDEVWDGEKKVSSEAHHGPQKSYSSQEEFLTDFYLLLENNLLYSQCTKLYRREIVDRGAVRFDESLSMGEDISFNLDLFPFVRRAAITERCLYHYVHLLQSGSISNVYCPGYYENVCMVLQKETGLLKRYRLLTARNQLALDNFFIGRVSSALQNELNHDYRHRFWEKYRTLRKIVSSLPAREAAKRQKTQNRFHRLVAFCIRFHLSFVLYLAFLLLRRVKRKNQGMLLKMKDLAK